MFYQPPEGVSWQRTVLGCGGAPEGHPVSCLSGPVPTMAMEQATHTLTQLLLQRHILCCFPLPFLLLITKANLGCVLSMELFILRVTKHLSLPRSAEFYKM